MIQVKWPSPSTRALICVSLFGVLLVLFGASNSRPPQQPAALTKEQGVTYSKYVDDQERFMKARSECATRVLSSVSTWPHESAANLASKTCNLEVWSK